MKLAAIVAARGLTGHRPEPGLRMVLSTVATSIFSLLHALPFCALISNTERLEWGLVQPGCIQDEMSGEVFLG